MKQDVLSISRLIAIIVAGLQAVFCFAQAVPQNMVLIPAGSFIYGEDAAATKRLMKELRKPYQAGLYEGEVKRQTLSLPDFYIDRTEVTNAAYAEFVRVGGGRPSRFAAWPQFKGPQQPVVGIGWSDAIAYCTWRSKRLPTEQEWEKAARSTDGRPWPWGKERDSKRYNGKELRRYGPDNVGRYPAGNSPYGISDMAGNVWEMTASKWPSNQYEGVYVMRGGSFLNNLAEVRVTVRWAAGSEEHGAEWLGFRCAKDR
jgi:formylglycine-generating enzyme required for sulfatase activity